ncbi:phosphoheptose isomerase [Azorhizobium oxalatiphilum]|uniref:Phosphoheptose isomerase n=1 Tax=Azorhizobium oxalatiphilum TaxID=980631 RepID=A0A917C0G1_9HYPH|nr:D-sedoheptulose 7-phosphate isomerase [Azorhizobium oxalatiphilum]GGF62082.1 phosphoheptose isomerase [Azorhizobium oxalatiphilum]
MPYGFAPNIRDYYMQSRDALDRALASPEFLRATADIAGLWTERFAAGRKILLCGNGGSAGDAQHIAGELLCRFRFDRAPLPALALTVDSSVMTAIGNDYAYDQIFSRQVLGLATEGDVVVGISTSGRSPNVVKALEAARSKGATTVAFTGEDPRDLGALADLVLKAPSASTPIIQQIHMTAAHIICELVEVTLFPKPNA